MNLQREHFSEEILNAYIDGELSPEDSARITLAMESDEILRRRVNDLNKVSELVRAAFADVYPPESEPARKQAFPAGYPYWRIAASVAFLGLAGMLGWHIYDHHMGRVGVDASLVAGSHNNPTAAGGPPSTQSAQGTMRVMFHIGRNDETLFNKVLDETDRLLAKPGDNGDQVTVRIVASHDGLSLFQLPLDSHGKRVRDLKMKYGARVAFVGCGETLKLMRSQLQVQKMQLFPEMIMVDSGVMDLLRRQRQGWTFVYI